MNSDEATKLLEKSVREIDGLEKSHRFSREHTKWVSNTIYLLEELFGKKSRIFISFWHLTWQFRGSTVIEGYQVQEQIDGLNNQAYLEDLDSARGILESGIELIKRKGLDSVYEGKDTPKEASEILKIVSLVENNLRKVVRNKPTKETEINDALEALFIGAGLDGEFTREKEHIIYSSKTYIPDFVFKQVETIVETKFCDSEGRKKEIIGEINDDIVAYQTKYANLIFVVYDMGIIRNIDEFRESIEKQKSVIVKIIKH
ncbi:hypothetical protein MUO79_03115 [Candidatus Bathyarchaeota archaeon]|nr:hypothetical protein [Candidatus Bathyarchaeota archaeon]